ncbi:MAG: hypothetical protein ABSD27_14505 [Bryobacteraceae bacterium]|jgi:hypothetical protein
MKRRYALIALPLALLLSGCSEQPKPVEKPKPATPPEPVSALSAVYKMYTQARAWAPDCWLLRVGALDLKEVPSQGGKAGAWEATFVSERAGQSRRYTYSVVESVASNLRAGVVGGSGDSWSPGGPARPFLIQALKVDSPAALETAMKKGAAYAQKHPELPIRFLLEQTSRFPDPAWRVIWGESVSRSGFSIFVNATTGEYLQTAH